MGALFVRLKDGSKSHDGSYYPEAITFPAVDAKLTKEIIKSCKMETSLRRFAKKLGKQLKVNAVEICSVGITFVKDISDYEKKQYDERRR